ncbi:MAG: hypothetical protein HQ515_09915 [Phycisphaeraceae bacterium]|nr:hypothetical protein [Phycisphaeraceae bacterium]
MMVMYCASMAAADLDGHLFRVRIAARSRYLSDVPVLVRVEVQDKAGRVERGLWDAVATLTADNPAITYSPAEVTMYNGLGSALVTFTGSGDFSLTAEVNGLKDSKAITHLAEEPVTTVSGSVTTSETWRGLYHITGGDFKIPAGVTLTLDPGTLVMIDGVTSGSGGADINVSGAIQSLGTPESPVTFTAYETGKNWGELHHENAEPSTFRYTNIHRGGRSPSVGHSGTGPTLRVKNSAIIFEHANLTDNAGKLMHATSGSDLTFLDCLFARCVMGPEMSATALLFQDSWITNMSAKDDADGIYVHSQRSDQTCVMRGGVVANIVDDGIDLLGADITIEDCIIRDCDDKGISAYNGVTQISHCLVVNNNRSPEDPTVTSVAAKATGGATTIVNMDHTTIVTTRTPGVIDFGIQSHNKRGETRGAILWHVFNCIIDATDPINVQAPYLESDVRVDHSDLFSEPWPGPGNINAAPDFVDPDNGDYHLTSQAGHWSQLTGAWMVDQITSACIDAGSQADPLGHEAFPNGGIVNMGFYAATPQASRSYFDAPVCETIVAGDINGDCLVNFKDFALMALHWAEDNTQ